MNQSAALVTGAATRLGSRFAIHLAERGYDIALHCNHSTESAQVVATAIRKLGVECEIFSRDFGDGFDAEEMIGAVVSRFPALNCLVNSASAYAAGTIGETTREQLQQQFNVNLMAPYLLTASFARRVESGQVINIIDNKVAWHQYQYSAYLLAKKALAEFTKMAALEFAPAIKVNGIAPGVILPMDSRTDDYIQWRIEGIPLHRKGQPDHLMQAMDYLLQNDFVSGQILFVDGGESDNLVGRNAEDFRSQAAGQETATPAASETRHWAIVSVGSNIDPEQNLEQTKEILTRELNFLGEATVIETEPDGYKDQPNFFNGAYWLETTLPLPEFNAYLKSVESRMGRVKGPLKSGPRCIDLDIIIWDGEIVHRDYHAKKYYVIGPVDELIKKHGIQIKH